MGLLPHNDYIVLFCHILQEKQLLWSWKREEKGEYDAQGGGGIRKRDFSGGSVVKNSFSNARDTGLIPGWGNRITHTVEQLAYVPPLRSPSPSGALGAAK